MNNFNKQQLARTLSTARGVPIFDGLEQARSTIQAVRSLDFNLQGDFQLDQAAAALRQELVCAKNQAEGSPNQEHLARIFAISAEFCRRELGLVPFDEQLAAGLAMHLGQLAQMQTGEGKTLAAVFPAIASAIGGIPVLILTANDYLARRDTAWMAPVYERWGLSVAFVQDGQSRSERKLAYQADIVYLTAREAGFDYLRDRLAWQADELVQREFGLAIVDEADLLLIDEARIPLVIAGADPTGPGDLARIDLAAAQLVAGLDFTIDPAGRRLSLTMRGEQHAANLLGIEGMHRDQDRPHYARLHAALHARHLVRRDVDYLVRQGRIELVDGFTGRVAERRQWPWGIQAALEALEGLEVQPEGRIYGRITMQHFIAVFPRLAAMTATAEPAAAELQECYGLSVAVIPPRLPLRRVDEPDLVYRTRSSKMVAVRQAIGTAHRQGQPVLVGTASVAESETLARELEREGIRCQVLNARQDEHEAKLIAQAGRRGMVTISTNMAGRGTDIKLGDPEQAGSAGEVAALGGLLVIGTDRHESRRIDDQLRGRSGRQGEPGRTRYFVSLEDSFFVRYGVPEFLPEWPESEADQAASKPRFLAEIDRASRLIESQNAQLRRSLRRYAALVEMDRRYISRLRQDALLAQDLPEELLDQCHVPGDAPAPRLLVKLWLHHLDEFWADHLAWIEDLREGIHLVQYGGRDPGQEYNRQLAERFEQGLAETMAACALDWRRLPIDAGEADLAAMGAKRPSTTWTYLVNENVLPDFTMAMIASANMGAAALAAFPLWIATGMGKLIKRLARSLPKT